MMRTERDDQVGGQRRLRNALILYRQADIDGPKGHSIMEVVYEHSVEPVGHLSVLYWVSCII